MGLALWFAARRLFSEGAANVALALFAFTPSLIAHFSVATTDGIGTLFIFLAAFQLVRWRRNQTAGQTVLLGLVLGGLLLAKFYAPPMVALALALMLVLGPSEWLKPRQWNWKAMFATLAIALATLWAGYFFHVSHLTVGEGQVVATYPNRPVRVFATKSKMHLSLVVPAGEFVEGLREVALSNRRGRPSWFLGKIYPKGGIKLYYPVAIALKWPTIFLLLLFASLLLGVHKTCRSPSDLLVMSLFAVVYLLFALQSKYDIGERHILPLYPFALLIAGGVWEHARKRRAWMPVVLVALALNAADALRYAPDYLSYFNIFVRPQNSWRLLTDSNLDWGQGLISLRKYEQQHPGETDSSGILRLSRSGTVRRAGCAVTSRSARERYACGRGKLPVRPGTGRSGGVPMVVERAAHADSRPLYLDVRGASQCDVECDPRHSQMIERWKSSQSIRTGTPSWLCFPYRQDTCDSSQLCSRSR